VGFSLAITRVIFSPCPPLSLRWMKAAVVPHSARWGREARLAGLTPSVRVGATRPISWEGTTQPRPPAPLIEDALHFCGVPDHDDVREEAQRIGDRLHLVAALRGAPSFSVHYFEHGVTQQSGWSPGLGEASVLQMVKRRAVAVDQPAEVSCHSFRATGITDYLANGGELGNAEAFAGHELPTTTKLYDRTGQELSLEEIERIPI